MWQFFQRSKCLENILLVHGPRRKCRTAVFAIINNLCCCRTITVCCINDSPSFFFVFLVSLLALGVILFPVFDVAFVICLVIVVFVFFVAPSP
jgi:hypothetical protein